MMANFQDDIGIWQEVIKSVKALSKNKKVSYELRPIPKIKPVDSKLIISHTSTKRPCKELIINNYDGVDRSTAKKISKGSYVIDSTLDLHGMHQDQAFSRLQNFIQEAFQSNKRLLLVIVGKGNKSPDNRSVLRESMPQWLNYPGLRELIISVTTASLKHGGKGALYIFLKKNKK